MRSSPSLLSRALEPLAAGLWIVFVLVSIVVGVIWAWGIDDAHLAGWVLNRDLLATLQWLLRQMDFLWITLAAANSYLCLAQREGLDTARRAIMTVLVAVTALGWVSAGTGVPLGPIRYGLPLGPIVIGGVRVAQFGPVPLGLPLFWFAIVVCSRDSLLRLFPRRSHVQIAVGTALLALLTDFSLEPLAAKLRGFWFWRSGTPTVPPVFDAPFTGCLAWGLLAGLVAFGLRERRVFPCRNSQSWQPAMTLVIFHIVFLAAHFGRWVRG